MTDLQKYAEIPPGLRKVLLDNIKPANNGQKQLMDKLEKIIRKDCQTLLISGNKGTGKTYLAIAALNTALYKKWLQGNDNDRTIKYVTHFEIDMRFKSGINDRAKTQADVYYQYCSYEYLVIDEIGRGSTSDYSMGFLENVISRRYAWGNPTILITNKTTEELKQLFDAQILDRLGNDKQETFALEGVSLR